MTASKPATPHHPGHRPIEIRADTPRESVLHALELLAEGEDRALAARCRDAARAMMDGRPGPGVRARDGRTCSFQSMLTADAPDCGDRGRGARMAILLLRAIPWGRP
jgi:transposase InsO family protein